MRFMRLDSSRRPSFPQGGVLGSTIVLVLALALAGPIGCSIIRGPGGAVTGAAADVVLPPSDEEKLGDQFSEQVEEELELHSGERINSYIRQLGEAAVTAAGDDAPDPIEFEFHVVDAPDTQNAFAGPGGQIYFYSGLLLTADNLAEVMAVMSHEVAHVTKRHVARRLVAAYGVQALASAALGDNPGLIAQLATSVAAQGYMLKHSRDAERQADLVGFDYVTRTNVDPVGFVTYFEKLTQNGARPPAFLMSHPSPEQRIEYLREELEKHGEDPDDILGREVHQQILESIDRPEEREGQARHR